MQHYHYRVNRAEANCSTETIAQHRTCCDSCTAQNSHAQKLTAVTAAEQQPKRQWQTACCSCEPASNTAAAADSVAIARVESTNNCRFVIQTVATVLTSMPSASATTRMSLNRIAASMLYLRTGWRVTSATSAGS
eukprot:20088-Heterococcus_DN1.PRE.4